MLFSIIGCVTGIIGCLTGVFGAIMSIKKFWPQRERIEILFDSKQCIYFDRLKDYRTFRTKNQALASLEIHNQSAMPIGISSVKFSLGNGKMIPPRDYPYGELTLPENAPPGIVTTIFDVSNHQIDLPLNLPPYHVVKGYMFFPFFPFDTSTPVDVDVIVRTTRHKKEKIFRCTFTPFESTPLASTYNP